MLLKVKVTSEEMLEKLKMIRLSEVAEKGVELPFHPLVFGFGMFGLLVVALIVVTRLNADR